MKTRHCSVLVVSGLLVFSCSGDPATPSGDPILSNDGGAGKASGGNAGQSAGGANQGGSPGKGGSGQGGGSGGASGSSGNGGNAGGSGPAGSGGASGSSGSGGTSGSPSDVLEVAGGGEFSCARRADGSVLCWGAGNSGQLGTGVAVDSLTPVVVKNISDAQQLSVGYQFACAMRAGGVAQCWGANGSGQLGDSTLNPATTPTTHVQVTSPVQMPWRVQGHYHGCATLADATVWCWGSDHKQGVLGRGVADTEYVPHPEPARVVELTGVGRLATGHFHSCAIITGGAVKCWGFNGWGELGNGTMDDQAHPTPVTVTGLTQATQLGAGQQFSCALLSDGTVNCWGKGSYGKLGNDQKGFSTTPVAVMNLTEVKEIALGAGHACALREEGTVWCWGRNDHGQTADDPSQEHHTAYQVPGLSDVTSIGLGDMHSCAVRSDGTAWCWGQNTRGQLGNKSTDDAHAPVQVSLPN